MILNPYRFAASGATDPDFASVVALLHCDGANGSTTFTDQTGKTWAPTVGSPQISTAQSKFGGASGDLTSDNLACSHADFSGLAAGDFTLEAWARLTSHGANTSLFGMGDSGSNYWQCTLHPSVGMTLNIFGSNLLQQGSTTGISLNTWMHVAFVRSGNNLYGFIDGVLRASSASGASLPSITSNTLYLGSNSTPAGFVDGYYDDFRITKGVARYTSGFTPPTAAFPNS